MTRPIAIAQDVPSLGVHYSKDGDKIVGLSYYGVLGLRRMIGDERSNLESVDVLYHTTLTADDISVLSTLENVSELSVGGNLNDEFVTFEGSLSKLAGMKNLRRIFLCKAEMRDEDLEFVAKLPKLESLEFLPDTNPSGVVGPTVTDQCAEFLRYATTLVELGIDEAKFTDRFISIISQDLRNLERLRLSSNGFTDKSLEMLANQCVKLKCLDLYSNGFTDMGVRHLAKATNLEELSLISDSLTSACVVSIEGLIGLKHLELTIPFVEANGVQILASLPNLEILVLRDSPLTDEQFAKFRNHPALQSAFLNGSELSEANAIEVIKTMPQLVHMNVGKKSKSLQIAINRLLEDRKTDPNRKRT